MRRIAIISGILGLLIVADGIFQQITRYNDGETQDLLHLGRVELSDGVTLLISGGVVLIVALIAFLMPERKVETKK